MSSGQDIDGKSMGTGIVGECGNGNPFHKGLEDSREAPSLDLELGSFKISGIPRPSKEAVDTWWTRYGSSILLGAGILAGVIAGGALGGLVAIAVLKANQSRA